VTYLDGQRVEFADYLQYKPSTTFHKGAYNGNFLYI